MPWVFFYGPRRKTYTQHFFFFSKALHLTFWSHNFNKFNKKVYLAGAFESLTVWLSSKLFSNTANLIEVFIVWSEGHALKYAKWTADPQTKVQNSDIFLIKNEWKIKSAMAHYTRYTPSFVPYILHVSSVLDIVYHWLYFFRFTLTYIFQPLSVMTNKLLKHSREYLSAKPVWTRKRNYMSWRLSDKCWLQYKKPLLIKIKVQNTMHHQWYTTAVLLVSVLHPQLFVLGGGWLEC